MPLMHATPSKGKPDPDAAHHIKTPHPHNPQESYHVGHHRHVERSYDKHSKLYHPDLWNWHDLYDKQLSYSGVVTRSQTAFNRIEMDKTHVLLFNDKALHHPHDLPHLMMTMKDGTYGAIPRTIVTRSTAEKLEINPTLIKIVDIYKSLVPLEITIEKHSRHPSLLQRLLSRKESAPIEVEVEIKMENTNDEGENEEKNEYRNLTEASPTIDGSVRFNENPVQGSDLWRNKPLIRESSFSLESQKNLSQTGVLKAPSFSIILNSLSNTLWGSLDSQSWREEVQVEKMNEFFYHQTLTEASPTRVGYIEQQGINPALSGKHTPLIRESLFSQETLKNLSQPIGVLKSPSFSVTLNSLSDTFEGSMEVDSPSRREEYQENQAPLPLVPSRGVKRFRSPSPDSRDFLRNRIKGPIQLPMQANF